MEGKQPGVTFYVPQIVELIKATYSLKNACIQLIVCTAQHNVQMLTIKTDLMELV